MSVVKIITPPGMFGATADDSMLDTAMRVIGVAFAEEGEWASKYGTNYENDVFAMRTQYWGDCTCGYDQRETDWCEAHEHSSDCYQSDLDAAKLASGLWIKEPQWSFLTRKDGIDYEQAHAVEDKIYDDLCAKHKVDRNFGAAVHCTCEHGPLWKAFCDTPEGQHSATCLTILPNFKHKASGFEVEWYKYIGRDMEIKGTPPDDLMQQVFASHPRGMTLNEAVALFEKEAGENAAAFQRMVQSLNAHR
jgi:hypothetical protein